MPATEELLDRTSTWESDQAKEENGDLAQFCFVLLVS